MRFDSFTTDKLDRECVKCGTVNPETIVECRDGMLYLLCATCRTILDAREEDWESNHAD